MVKFAGLISVPRFRVPFTVNIARTGPIRVIVLGILEIRVSSLPATIEDPAVISKL